VNSLQGDFYHPYDNLIAAEVTNTIADHSSRVTALLEYLDHKLIAHN